MSKRFFCCASVFILCITLLYAQNAMRYPRIQTLNTANPVFKQYTQEVTENYRRIARGDPVILNLYAYMASDADDLLAIAARCNIPYESIVLLNKIFFMDSSVVGKILILPTSPGIFIAKTPVSPLEFLLKTRYSDTDNYTQYVIEGRSYSFIPNNRLTSTERAFFSDSSMTPPLEIGVISSSYGRRISPITGQESFHRGTDIAAPKGTAVFACKSGITAYSDTNDAIYGNYIILQHENKTQSFYAHLDTILIEEQDVIEKGEQIATVGNTGMSTGPHLHFEIRIGGSSQDPSTLIKNFMQ